MNGLENALEWLKSIHHEHRVYLDGRRKEIETAISGLEELKRWRTNQINEKIKNPFANTSTLICHNCDHKDEYIEELERELDEYRAIGTVEECRSAREKMKPKNPVKYGDAWQGLDNSGNSISWQEDCYECPNCESFLGYVRDWKDEQYRYNNCPNCGQELMLEDI